MTKIYYSEESLYKLVSPSLNDTLSCIRNSLNYCNYSYPGSFSYASYLKKLPSTINEYQRKVNGIMRSIGEIDKGYSYTFESMESALSGLDVSVVEERSRLVK